MQELPGNHRKIVYLLATRLCERGYTGIDANPQVSLWEYGSLSRVDFKCGELDVVWSNEPIHIPNTDLSKTVEDDVDLYIYRLCQTTYRVEDIIDYLEEERENSSFWSMFHYGKEEWMNSCKHERNEFWFSESLNMLKSYYGGFNRAFNPRETKNPIEFAEYHSIEIPEPDPKAD